MSAIFGPRSTIAQQRAADLVDLAARLAWQYDKPAAAHMRSAAWVADLTALGEVGAA
jgi:hypothetical protein